MRADIHPEMHPVIFVDGEHEVVTRSTLKTEKTRTVDGVEHYIIPIEISAFTHPFYTGQQRIIDTAGQVERFMRRLEVGADHRQATIDRAEAERKAELEAKRKRRGLVPFADSIEVPDDEEETETTEAEEATEE